ncbi:hypothetical protein IWW55_000306 [Coemansia sp. RSA 2706]|nr:hypothetical protein LPJ63_005070 [Coemansia sp. RSA 2711]KAJ1839014.1 hypothetical protein LPJ70_005229 [Coemansia sp. RSA 2708]KAJ2308677.1 hypothetical protein IWW55_000306 [Coemansia sp. RSA 2706]KAJ2315234.1 hypothetical protein IWW54_000429 [Coemansia sp. RSA 2705]KAJ2322008.1 hypothetical protein IWW52_000366 [Coemansia sp. RSA 2704]KAJ2369903.1 hypothetical protein H4S01_000709 [Coemansia sp. RSA 2610]KAJ2393251.1 hypothetical protein H4S02_000326 [Coemansia sp. RSA 2611]KAJ272789
MRVAVLIAIVGSVAALQGVKVRLPSTPSHPEHPCLDNPCPSGKGCAELQPVCPTTPCYPEVLCI